MEVGEELVNGDAVDLATHPQRRSGSRNDRCAGAKRRGSAWGQVFGDGDERAETFHACTSGEGVHLSIWSAPRDTTAPLPRDGSPPGNRRWHRYHNLGEDVENTCTAGETR